MPAEVGTGKGVPQLSAGYVDAHVLIRDGGAWRYVVIRVPIEVTSDETFVIHRSEPDRLSSLLMKLAKRVWRAAQR